MTRTLQPIGRNRIEHRGHHHRHANLWAGGNLRAVKVRRRHANDRHGFCVQQYFLPDDGSVAAKSRLPIAIAQNSDGVTTRHSIILFCEQPPNPRPDTQNLEVASGNHFAPRLFALARIAGVECDSGSAEDPGKHGVFIAQGLIHWVGKVFVLAA